MSATLKQIIEALMFASHKPLMPKEIGLVLRNSSTSEDDLEASAYAKTKDTQIVAVLEELQKEYEQLDRAFQLVEQVNGWYVVTKPNTAKWVRHLYPESKPARLSGPALETLAIIAYRQPIMKADIEAVRGVAVDGVLQALLERNLIKIHGRAEVPGRPLLYATSEYFLEHFGLKSLDELPNTAELRRINLPTAKKNEPPVAASSSTVEEASPEDGPSQPTDHRTSNESPEPDLEQDDQQLTDTDESLDIPEDREIVEEEVDSSEQSPQPDEPDTEDPDRVLE